MELMDRLEFAISDKNMTVSSVEKELGFGNATIRRWRKSSPSVDNILKIAHLLNLNIEWLLEGIGTPYKTESPTLPPLDDIEMVLIENFRELDYHNKFKIIGMIELKMMEQKNSIARSSMSISNEDAC